MVEVENLVFTIQSQSIARCVENERMESAHRPAMAKALALQNENKCFTGVREDLGRH